MAAIAARVSADWQTEMVWVGLDAGGAVEVWTLSGGDWSAAPLAQAATPYSAAVTRTLVVSLSGTSLKVSIDGAQVLVTTVPAATSTSTKVGIYGNLIDGVATSWPMFESLGVVAGP